MLKICTLLKCSMIWKIQHIHKSLIRKIVITNSDKINYSLVIYFN